MKRVIEFDVFFLSYDEPNADLHYADLCNKVPWAKRIHGVKGSDHAHKAANLLKSHLIIGKQPVNESLVNFPTSKNKLNK